MEMMHTLSPIRCLDNTRVLGWVFLGHRLGPKKARVRHNEAKLDSMVFSVGGVFVLDGFLGPFIMGVI